MNPWDKDVVQPSEPQQPVIPAEGVVTPAPVAPAPWDKDTFTLTAEEDALMQRELAAAREANYVSPLESAWVSTKRTLFPAGGGLTAAGVGARLGAPFGPWGVAGGATILGGLGAIFSEKVQEGLNPITEEQQRILNANPRAAILGGIIPQIATSTITPVQNVKGLAQLGKAAVGAGPMTDLAKSTGISTAMNTGVGMGLQYATQGEITPGHTALNVGLGTLLGRPNRVGNIPFATGYGVTDKALVAANKLRQNIFPQRYTSDVPIDFEVVNEPIVNRAGSAEIPMPPNANPKVWGSLTPEGKAAYAADLAAGRWNQPAIGAEAAPVVEQPPAPAPIKPAPVVEQPAVPAPVKPAPAPTTEPSPAPVLPARPTSQTEIPGTEDAFNLAGQEAAPAPTPKATTATPELVPPTEEAWVGPARKRLADLEAQGQDKGTEAAALRTLIDNAGKPATPVTPEPPVAPSAETPAPVASGVRLPRDLAGSKPRYAYGEKNFEPVFESDLDKAAFIVSQGTKNKRHDDFVKWATKTFGITETQLSQHGQRVRQKIKDLAREARGGTSKEPEQLRIPAGETSTPATQPVAKPAAPQSQKPVVAPQPTTPPAAQPRKLWRGTGRAERGSIYSPGSSGPILGDKGKYYAFNETEARQYGPNVESTELSAKNPLVIKNDEQWRALIKEAGWKYANPIGRSPEQAAIETKAINDLLAAKGHDAVIIDGIEAAAKAGTDDAKTLSQVFGHDQAYVIEASAPAAAPAPVKPAPAAAPATTTQKPNTLTTTTDDLVLTRIGDQSEGGNYYGIEGQTQYEGGQRHVMPKGSKVADLRDPDTADAVINETLKDANLTPEQRTVLEEARGQGDIDYTIFDETPMADAARRLGYDAARVVENQDAPGTASSVFVLNNKALRPAAETATAQKTLEAAKQAPAKEPSGLVVVIGKDRYQVGSLREATVKWMSVVRKIESEGGSLNDPEYAGIYAMGGPRVEDSAGNFVGKIADNGNIFDTPKNTVKTKLLYGPTERDFDDAGYGNKPIEVGGKPAPVEPVMPAVAKEETIPAPEAAKPIAEPTVQPATPIDRRAAGARKAWETRRNRSARVERDFGKTFDEANETPPGLRIDEPSDVLDARARILASTKGGRSLDRGSRDVAIVNQYEADRHIALGNHQPEYLRVASDEALREYVDQVYFAQQQAAESGEAPPSAEDVRKADALQRALDDRNAVQQELGSGNADATPTAVLDAAVSAAAATGKRLPLYPPEFEGAKTWRALYESLPADVRDKLFNNFRGQLDLAKMRDPALGASYRAEIALKAEADASDLWTAIAENGNPAFDLGKNNMDVGMEALRNAGFGADEAPVGNLPRLYNTGGKGETPFGFAPLTAPGVLGGMDVLQTGLTAALASDKAVPGLNPISANMHLLADGRGFGALYAGTPDRFVPSKTMKSVAEMFLIRGGRTAEGAQETFYGQRDAERRRMTGKLLAAFDPVAEKLNRMTEAQLGRFDTEMARMLSGEAPIDPNTPEGKVAIAVKKLSDEAHAYATEAGLEIGYAKDYGMPHSINASAVDKNQTGFLEAATRAYAINNPKRIAALTNKLKVAKPEEAVKIQAEIDFLNKATPAEQAQSWLDNILNGAEGTDRRMGLLLDGGAQATNTANFTNERVFVPEARAVLREFYNNNPIVAWRRYIDRVATMAEFSRRFGPSGEKWTKMVAQMRKEGASETQIQLFKEHVKDSLGSLNPRPSSGHALANSALAVSNITKLKLTAAANFLESMAPATRGQFTALITGPFRMLRNTLDLVAEMTPAEAQSFREALGREASTPNGAIQLARAVGLIDAAGVHEILNNSAHMIDSEADYQGVGRGGSGDRVAIALAQTGQRATSGIARAYGIEVTENAKRADAAQSAANRIDGFTDGVLDDGVLARAYAVAKPNATSNPFSIKGESIIRLRRAGISDAEMDAFAKAWRSHREAGDLESWIASDDPMAVLARKAVRLEAGQASVSSDRSFGTGGKEGALVSQDHLFGKAVMTYMRYPSAALQQVFKPMAQDVSAAAKGGAEGVDFSPYSRARMGMQALGLPMMATAAAAYLLMKDMINGYNDKTIWQRVVEGFGYTGATGGKSEMVNKAFRGEIPPFISEVVQIMKDINRAEKGQGQRVLVNNAVKSIGQPLTQAGIALAVPNPMAAVLIRMAGTKQAREEVTNAVMEPKPKPDTRGSGRR